MARSAVDALIVSKRRRLAYPRSWMTSIRDQTPLQVDPELELLFLIRCQTARLALVDQAVARPILSTAALPMLDQARAVQLPLEDSLLAEAITAPSLPVLKAIVHHQAIKASAATPISIPLGIKGRPRRSTTAVAGHPKTAFLAVHRAMVVVHHRISAMQPQTAAPTAFHLDQTHRWAKTLDTWHRLIHVGPQATRRSLVLTVRMHRTDSVRHEATVESQVVVADLVRSQAACPPVRLVRLARRARRA
jgi:hypothetical protein